MGRKYGFFGVVQIEGNAVAFHSGGSQCGFGAHGFAWNSRYWNLQPLDRQNRMAIIRRIGLPTRGARSHACAQESQTLVVAVLAH